MENLSPHREFKGPPLQRPGFRPFYEFKWPEDLPSKCNLCGFKFRPGWNLEVGPNRIGRFLRRAAKISFVPFWLSIIGIPVFFNQFFPALEFGEQVTSWFILTMFFLPPVMYFISLCMPITRLVECKKCGWSHDYPGLHKRDSKGLKEEKI